MSFRYTAEPSILQNLDLPTDVRFGLENSWKFVDPWEVLMWESVHGMLYLLIGLEIAVDFEEKFTANFTFATRHKCWSQDVGTRSLPRMLVEYSTIQHWGGNNWCSFPSFKVTRYGPQLHDFKLQGSQDNPASKLSRNKVFSLFATSSCYYKGLVFC